MSASVHYESSVNTVYTFQMKSDTTIVSYNIYEGIWLVLN